MCGAALTLSLSAVFPNFKRKDVCDLSEEYAPLKLIKNKVFPSYQFSAAIEGSKIAPEETLKICILEALYWIRQKFENLDIPEEMKSVSPSRYQEFDLGAIRSFRLERGYIVEVIYLESQKSWSLQLVEPDLSLPVNQPVPGRVFTTDIAFRLVNSTVQCGIRTLVSEPETCDEPVLSLRIGIVKRLVRNNLLKLSHTAIPIGEKPIVLNTDSKLTTLEQNVKNPLRSMPLLVFAEYKPPETPPANEPKETITALSDLPMAKSVLSTPLSSEIGAPELNTDLAVSLDPKSKQHLANSMKTRKQKPAAAPAKLSRPAGEKQASVQPYYLYEMADVAKEFMGYAVVYSLPFQKLSAFARILKTNLLPGNVLVYDPMQPEKPLVRDCTDDPAQVLESLRETLKHYPLNSAWDFREIHFVNDARIIRQEELLSECRNRKEMASVISTISQELDTVKSTKKELETARANEAALEKKLKDASSRCLKLTEKLEKLELTTQQKLEKLENENMLLRVQNNYYASLDERPKTPPEIAAWVRRRFAGTLELHKRATDLLDKLPAQEVDMRKLCDAIEYLATEYYGWAYARELTEAQASQYADLKYHQSFIVSPCGGGNVEHGHYSKDYKIKLDKHDGKGRREYPLDMHLKSGIESANLIRIYFHYDSYNKRIIVGSLPKHLPIKGRPT